MCYTLYGSAKAQTLGNRPRTHFQRSLIAYSCLADCRSESVVKHQDIGPAEWEPYSLLNLQSIQSELPCIKSKNAREVVI